VERSVAEGVRNSDDGVDEEPLGYDDASRDQGEVDPKEHERREAQELEDCPRPPPHTPDSHDPPARAHHDRAWREAAQRWQDEVGEGVFGRYPRKPDLHPSGPKMLREHLRLGRLPRAVGAEG